MSSRKSRFIKASVIGIAATLLSCAPVYAFSEGWNHSSGQTVSVCFTSTILNANQAAMAKVAADTWNGVTTALQVSYNACDGSGSNVHKVPIKLGRLNDRPDGTTMGDTSIACSNSCASGSGNRFIDANMTLDPNEIAVWGRQGGSMADAWRGVLCHEMGHALGLEHTKETDSCMQTNTSVPTTMPGKTDVSQLLAYYGGHSNGYVAGASGQTSGNTRSVLGNAVPNLGNIDTGDLTSPAQTMTKGMVISRRSSKENFALDNDPEALAIASWRHSLQASKRAS